MSRPAKTRPRAEQREEAAREDRVDLALQGSPRASVGGRRGVFSRGFPRLVSDLFYTSPRHHIIYRRWGIDGNRGIGRGS